MDMMQIAPLNAELSEKVYRSMKKRCQPRMCYTNVYRVATDNFRKILSGDWKIAYGYYTLSSFSEYTLARHAFLLDEENNVIDPTIYSQDTINLTHKYYVMYVFPSLEEYLQAVEESNFYPALEKYLRQQTLLAYRWATQNGYFLCG